MDNTVCVDRIGRWDRLEQEFTLHFDETVVDTDGTQRYLEPDLLCVSDAHGSVDGHRFDAANDFSIYEVKLFTNSGCDLFVRSLLRLGGFCYDSQCVDCLA